MPLLARIPSMVRIEQINSNGSFWSSKNLLINFIPNLSYLIDYRYHCAFSTLLFLLGNIVLFFKQRSRWLALSVWFLFFYLVSAAYFKGNFYYSDSDRYFLIAAVSFSISAGYGIYCLLQLKLHSLAKILFSFFLFLSVVVNSIFATKNITDYTLNRDAYAEYLFVKRTAKDLPQEQYILCYSPSYIISVINKKALKLEYFAKIEPPEKIVLFKGYWWHTLKDKSAYFGEVFDKLYRSEIIAEKEINNETKYGFYLLTRK